MKDYNKTYLSKATGGLFWYNRTERVLNINITLLRSVGPKLRGNVQVYKFLSNEFRYFPVTLSLNMCEEYKKNTFGLLDLFRTYSNVKVNSCPLPQGNYSMKNGKIDFSQFPPHIPKGTYKTEVKLFNDRDYLGHFDVIADVSPKEILRVIN
ncbi:hypothetical protein ILUMI_19676 [Ignelater luminosus]|uniref:Uncharacterized protein n=1 Tax=Ignelater luminosus TaxID=2038154 RepID=A0A8K0G2Z8_IGNLU|nr:hypothetical protein ILUMI_19676 [Ignelater luminosus]